MAKELKNSKKARICLFGILNLNIVMLFSAVFRADPTVANTVAAGIIAIVSFYITGQSAVDWKIESKVENNKNSGNP